jgi:hypothetical protein
MTTLSKIMLLIPEYLNGLIQMISSVMIAQTINAYLNHHISIDFMSKNILFWLILSGFFFFFFKILPIIMTKDNKKESKIDKENKQ